MIGFLDAQLRAGAGFSLQAEYPSLFGEYPGGESLYLESQGRVLSHVGILVREYRHANLRMRVGLLGSVVTTPEYRGQGLASRLVKEALELLRRRGALICLLWSEANAFYESFGFHRAGREWDFKLSPLHLPPPTDTGIVDYDPVRHAYAVWHLYGRHDVKLDRSLEEHKRLCSIPKSRIFVAEREGTPTAYIVVNKGADFENYVHEWGGEVDEVRRTLAWVQRQRFADRNLTVIAPAHYALEPLKRISLSHWEGVLGLMKLLDRTRLMLLYGDYLRGRGISFKWAKERNRFAIEGNEFPTETDRDCLRLVFGEGGVTSFQHPSLPFFLWGFDSI